MVDYKWKYWQTGFLVLALVMSGYTVIEKWRDQIRFYPGPGHISFNKGSIQGWNLEGLFDGDTNSKISAWNFPPFWIDNTDFSNKPLLDPTGDNKGAIMFPMGPGIPKSNSGKWRADFLSPDLSADNKWKGLNGITLAICDRASWSGLTPIEVRFSLKIKKPDGTVYLLDEKTNGQTKPRIHQLKPELIWEWNYLTAKLEVPKDHTVQQLIIRVYGTAFPQAYSSGFVAIDAISPFH